MSVPLILGGLAATLLFASGKHAGASETNPASAGASSAGGKALGAEPVNWQADAQIRAGAPPVSAADEDGTPITVGHDGLGVVVKEETGAPAVKSPVSAGSPSAPPVASSPAQKPAGCSGCGCGGGCKDPPPKPAPAPAPTTKPMPTREALTQINAATRAVTGQTMGGILNVKPGTLDERMALKSRTTILMTPRDSANALRALGPAAGAVW